MKAIRNHSLKLLQRFDEQRRQQSLYRSPDLLNKIQIGRVRREVNQNHVQLLCLSSRLSGMMRSEVIQNNDYDFIRILLSYLLKKFTYGFFLRVLFEIYNALPIYRIETESVGSHLCCVLLHRWFIEGPEPLSVCVELG